MKKYGFHLSKNHPQGQTAMARQMLASLTGRNCLSAHLPPPAMIEVYRRNPHVGRRGAMLLADRSGQPACCRHTTVTTKMLPALDNKRKTQGRRRQA
jgi:hypothetical protein